MTVEHDAQASFVQNRTGDKAVDDAVAAGLPATQLAAAGFTYPASVAVGVALRRHYWTVEADFQWMLSSSFDAVTLTFHDTPSFDTVLPQDYTSTWRGAIGVEYLIGDDWEVRGGYSYDHSPAPTPTISPFIHDADRHSFAAGGSYKYEQLRIDFNMRYLLFRSSSTLGLSRYNYDGTYESSAIARQGSAPVLTTVVRPRDAVQWALYYPPALDFRFETFQDPTWQAVAAQSIAAYKQSDFAAAFESIKGVPDNIADPSFFTYRAALLLAVGRNDEAGKDIERALSLRANDSAALALQAIIAVAQNEKDKALEAGQKAVTASPKSSSALIAWSYAQQAQFDLTGARASLKQAVAVNPNDALAWARLAELHLSFAELDAAPPAAATASFVPRGTGHRRRTARTPAARGAAR